MNAAGAPDLSDFVTGEFRMVTPDGEFAGFDFGIHVVATRTTHYLRNNRDGTWTWVTSQDVEPILDRNHALATSGDGGWNASKDIRRIGSIPVAVQIDWKNNKGVDIHNADHADGVRRLLNDIDYSRLRSANWRV